MSRSVEEWKGRTDDDRIPDRVRVRIYLSTGGRCHCCGRLILVGEEWQCDHKIALVNGGEHRENNLVPILKEHHKLKTREDVERKKKNYKVVRRHLGLKKSRNPLPGSRNSPWKKKLDGTVVKR